MSQFNIESYVDANFVTTDRIKGTSYDIIDENIIGQKGLGKLSFLNLSSVGTVEFFSHSAKVGMKIQMTDELDGFIMDPINNVDALPHPGLKVVIKKAKKKLISDSILIEYLSKAFAIRIARGAKIFVNNKQVMKPSSFDSREYPIFQLEDGMWIKGNLKAVEKPQINNISIFVKNVFVDAKDFGFKVEGWLNYNRLLLTSSRDAIHEEGLEYEKFMKGLMKHLEESYEKKSERGDINVKSEKQLKKLFVNVIASICNNYPDIAKPLMTGNPSGKMGIGGLLDLQGNVDDTCKERRGMMIDITKSAEPTIAKPIGEGKGHRLGNGESLCRTLKGNGRILMPTRSQNLFSGNDTIPEPRLDVVESEDRPVVFFSAPNRLVINRYWSSSEILINASPRDPDMKSRVLPLLVIAGINAYPGASEMSQEEWFTMYNVILDKAWSDR